MTENKRFTFEEHLKRNPMPTKEIDNKNYKIIEVKDIYWNSDMNDSKTIYL